MLDSPTFRVLIVGAGSAALEAAFRLQHVGENRVQTTILAPDDELATHAMAVLAPFAVGDVVHEPLARLAAEAGARLRGGRMASVDAGAHQVITTDGEAVRYDALLIAVGGVQRVPMRHALAFGAPGSEERMHGLVQDLEAGLVRRIKQGGLACQQADAAAEAIAAQAGAAIDPEPYAAVLQGVLLTQRVATHLRREASAGQVLPDEAVWWPPAKIAGRELSRHLGRPSPHATAAARDGVEIRRTVTPG